MKPKLTIGMATYDDFDGVFFTIQAIRMYHKEILDEIEFIIIDNNPSSAHSDSIRNFIGQIINHTPIKHVLAGDWKSTAVRDMVFQEASAPYVLCADSHVLLEPGSLAKLLQYYKEYPDTNNLLQGPMLYDCLDAPVTHMEPVWRDHMYGTWATNKLGIKPWAAPFEIPMHGMGLFTCRKEAWLGFNKKFKGFGGEEGYIHEKYRKAGYKTLCLPFLRWNHRFERPNGVKYRLDLTDRIWNYFVGHIENGLDVKPVVDHFNDHLDPKTVQGILDNVQHFIDTGEDRTILPLENKIEIIEIECCDKSMEVDNATCEILHRTEGTTCFGAPVPGKQIGIVYINGKAQPVFGDGAKPDSIKLYPHDHIYKRTAN
jgi:phage gp36-like protein